MCDNRVTDLKIQETARREPIRDDRGEKVKPAVSEEGHGGFLRFLFYSDTGTFYAGTSDTGTGNHTKIHKNVMTRHKLCIIV